MNPQRAIGLAAVFASGVWAGTMDSRNGNATATPAPRRKVRRDKCFFVMNIGAASLIIVSSCYLISFLFRVFRLFHLHLERSAFDDSENERRKLIVSAGGISKDRADNRHVVILDSTAEAVRQKHLGHGTYKLFRTLQNRLAKTHWALDPGSVKECVCRIDLRAAI